MIDLRRTVLVAALVATAATSAPAAETAAERAPGRITIVGEGTVNAVPNMATLTSGVVTSASTAREALDANTEAMAGVIEAFKKAGIAAKDIMTDGFSVQPRYVYPEPKDGSTQPPRIDGYEVRNQVIVRVRELAKLGTVLDAAVTTGANQMGGLSFDVAEPAVLIDKARAAAVEDAKRKAALYVQAAGAKLGRLIEIDETSMQMPPRPMMMARSMDFAEAKAVPVEAGEQTLRAQVRLTWELAD
ncbi:SIMPL domain-containing protein [Chelatococcus daeguensis]|uniref:SIMPL domain-containing protein n=2 Tax=Chelatococcus TaxID=28209 RepID=A0AAC9JNI3_9HYPH|nr:MULTISPECIES: SIMPL domain-containing protein [Chelatococcus]APF37152.1 hypothetical protein BOQ54_07255 [Chelatococcus daeguensis]KZE35670.1 hypothetical protein AVW15_11975 [Chelatococcus daeguensis]MBM3084951.1 SIMPL domain-containing protein [Chelatococcus daeguensis]CUA89362.1 Uncharacterized conserved protein YggE, contains kinase-interacting SIMPL domain [Chelatococcus sambhunathii]